MSRGGVGILGAGHALGCREQSNEELCAGLQGVTPEWIVEKTGIQRRYLVGPGQSSTSLATSAARSALECAGVSPSDVDMVVVCTFSGDYLFPPVATAIHRNLGLHASLTFDLQANCTGLVTGLTCASDRMRLDADLRFALVVGVEVLSPFVDWSDPQTAIYFSDGAGAVVLGRVPEGRGVQSAAFHTDSSNFESVRLRGGGSCLPFGREPPLDPDFGSWLLEMSGLATWRQAVTHLPPVARRACEKATLTPDQLDVLVFHQANIQIIHYVMRKMRLPVDRAFTNVERVGNAGAASMPIALSEAIACGKVGPGSKLLLAGVGAGFNFGASVWWMHDEFAPAADGEGKRS